MESLINYIYPSKSNKDFAFVVVKPGFSDLTPIIVNEFESRSWNLLRTRPKQLLMSEAKRLYSIHKDEKFYYRLCKYMSSGLTIGLLFTKDAEPGIDPYKEIGEIKSIIREKYGESEMRNVIHASDSAEHMDKERKIYFNHL